MDTITLEINKLYRVYRDEYIYFNEYVFNKINKNNNIKVYKWREVIPEELEVGDMLIADDDYVLKVLRIRPYNMKNNKLYFIYTCNGTFQIKSYKDKLYYSKFLGGYTPLDVTRNTKGVYRQPKATKKVFAELILTGMHPYKAFRISHNNRKHMTEQQLNKQVTNLITDKEVVAVLREGNEVLRDKIQEAFSDERMVGELISLLDRSRKGSDAHRENIKFVLQLLGKLPEEMIPKKTKSVNQIPEVRYEEVQPPKDINE